MPAGFFKSSTVISKNNRKSSLPKCGACKLFKSCKSPKMEVAGEGRKGILIVGEFPVDVDDARGVHFKSPQAAVLRDTLLKYGIDMRRDCWMTNALICKPSVKVDSKHVGYCQPNLTKTIKQLKPTCIIPLGFMAVKSVVSAVWKDDVGPLTRWLGYTIPLQKWNTWICPNFSLGYLEKQAEMRRPDPVPKLLFEKFIAKAVESAAKRPWNEIPNYENHVDVIRDPKAAAKILYRMNERIAPIAFDYETNMLKPDHPKARIVSCSVCYKGKKTIAYPWHGEAIKATRLLLRNKHPKRASNLKFEERWTMHHLGTKVRNWQWDTMISAHVLNNVPGVCSVKFQAFVLLGIDSYNDHIDPFLKGGGKGGYAINRIDEISLPHLLMYNGLDSLLEYLVAEVQMGAYV